MTRYADVYLLAVPKRNLAAYRRLAKAFARIAMSHGALECREFVSMGVPAIPGCRTLEQALKPKRGEVAISSIVGFRTKAHHDRVNQAIMTDPRMASLMKAKPLFDMKRMHVGDFKLLVEG